MFRLALILYAVIGTSLAGSSVVAALASGYDTTIPIIVAALIGAVIAFPISFLVARAVMSNR